MNLRSILLAGLATATLVGCGSDSPTDTSDVNVYLQFKSGDTFTYHHYTRDSTNSAVDGSKEVRTWTVLKTDTTVDGRNNVAAIQEIRYDASGTTESMRDTLYFSATAEGKVEQYDIVGNYLALIPQAAQYRDSVPDEWVRIGDVKTVGALTWASFPGIITVNDVVIPFGAGSITANIALTMNAMHVGRQALTTAAGSFTNNFRTNHNLVFTVNALGAEVAKDTIVAHYDIDTKGGVIRQSADSRTIVIGYGTQTIQQLIPGFEMELVSYTRAE